ncbi:hypothetical protein FRB91_000270 [Serendipita sp. 411]|nr:hypothetical protein FRB91_000270 [Serendipita sp. 411]
MQFWKPGTIAPGSTHDRATESEGSVLQSAPVSSAYVSLQEQRERLPIFRYKRQLLYAVEKYAVTIVVAETGSGKTTQLPQYLYEAGWASKGNVIACTQPRRVAATSVATRVAQEVGSLLGDEVGYTIRFEDASDKDRTRIKYMTDGMLFRETMIDPLLSRYSVIMVDEAHERSLYTDLLLGVLKKIRQKRPELRLIISSATLDASKFLDYFTSSPAQPFEATVVNVPGRMYPVEVAYLAQPTEDYVRQAVQVVWNLHLKGARDGSGDVLVFLTGREEIERALYEISELLPTLPDHLPRLQVLPLHAGLSTADQLEVFRTSDRGSRKVVISTNIAEASVTIDGICFVVDCGFVKIRTFNPTTSLSSLTTQPISYSSAIQRAGRAGRTAPGVCYRLYTSFGLSTESCEGDAKRLRRCLVSGLWRNGAKWLADGTYRSIRGNVTLHVHPTSVLFTRKPRSGWVIFHEMEETKKTQIRVLTEIEPDWLLEYGHKYLDKYTGEEKL